MTLDYIDTHLREAADYIAHQMNKETRREKFSAEDFSDFWRKSAFFKIPRRPDEMLRAADESGVGQSGYTDASDATLQLRDKVALLQTILPLTGHAV